MSNMSNSSGARVWGVDPAIVSAAVERARRERSLAFWAMLGNVFSRSETPTSDAPEPNAVAAR